MQWIDTAIRHNTYVACERYAPIGDIINLRAGDRRLGPGAAPRSPERDLPLARDPRAPPPARHEQAPRPDHELVGPAIAAAQAANIKLPVRGGFQQAKDEWGAFLFRTLITDPEHGQRFAEHALLRRLREVLRAPDRASSEAP